MGRKPENRKCTLPDCDNRHSARGFCSRHYYQWRLKHYAKKCSVDNCDRGQHSEELCDRHASRMRKYGTLESRLRAPRVAIPTYRSMHVRVAKHHGPASNHPCSDCGGPARHWSYDHSDDNEVTNPKTGCVYSLDVERYKPRCVSCHWRFDGRRVIIR